MFVGMYLCLYTYTYTHICKSTESDISREQKLLRRFDGMYVCMYVCNIKMYKWRHTTRKKVTETIWLCVCMHVCITLHTHTNIVNIIHTYIRVYVHTYTHRRASTHFL